MSASKQSQTGASIVWRDAPTTSVNVGGTKFVYRRLGSDIGVPVIFLNPHRGRRSHLSHLPNLVRGRLIFGANDACVNRRSDMRVRKLTLNRLDK